MSQAAEAIARAILENNLPEQITVRVGRVYEYDVRALLLAEDLIEGEPTVEKLLDAAKKQAMSDYDGEVDSFTENIHDFVSPKAFVTRKENQQIEYRDIGLNSGQIRTLNFEGGNQRDPFVIGHANPAMLDDTTVTAFYKIFRNEQHGADGDDESFFAYLRNFGYFNLVVSDETLVLI